MGITDRLRAAWAAFHAPEPTPTVPPVIPVPATEVPDSDGPVTTTEILARLDGAEPSAVLHALITDVKVPAGGKLTGFRRMKAQHDCLISEAITGHWDGKVHHNTGSLERWKQIGPTGRLLYAILAFDYPVRTASGAPASLELLDIVEAILTESMGQSSSKKRGK